MTEPDRPRRDVSITEAERMPMTEEELDEFEALTDVHSATAGEVALSHLARALVAEVRRLRAMVDPHRTGGFR